MLRKLVSFTVCSLVFFSQYPDYAQTTANAPEILWEKKIGGADTNELARCVQETLDGGYIIVGWKVYRKKHLVQKDLVEREVDWEAGEV